MIKCLENQTFKDFQVFFILDKKIEKQDFQNLFYTFTNWNFEKLKNLNISFFTNLNSKFIPWKWASYVRNFGINKAKTEFINLMDDDEFFHPEYLQQSLDLREKLKNQIQKDFVLTPTLMYRQTWQIQNQWFKKFNFLISRPIMQNLWNKERDYIQMYSWNSLLAPAYIFKQIQFDEKIDFVYEDLEFSYRIHKSWFPIVVSNQLKIYHMERDKTILEQARIWNPIQAYKKSKHRIIFVRKNWIFRDKIKFYLFWFWAQPLRLIFKILIYAKWIQKFNIISKLLKWTIDWISCKL